MTKFVSNLGKRDFPEITFLWHNTRVCLKQEMAKGQTKIQNLVDIKIHSRYFSPHSFYAMKNSSHDTNDLFSLFHTNVRSLKRNFENLQTHLLNELGYPFNIIGITETRITENDQSDHHPSISGYSFEFAPTPLAAGGVGMFIDENVKYRVIEKISSRAFQALWVELH